ncbi:Serine/threonine-protein kinase A-Raf [Temnothorax longispinosus]|uniref:Serine/threonine-protein kinase A-Raf n=1 Tax=Temnothorax longispinosus TaxID=300112 RepID=A0A4S2KNJ3_9HYME|nr:Serine/threonine-protein kinase A-Raf [Temnothorax longispinosus]
MTTNSAQHVQPMTRSTSKKSVNICAARRQLYSEKQSAGKQEQKRKWEIRRLVKELLQSSVRFCTNVSTKVPQRMAAKTQNATQDENKMTEPYKFDDSLEFAEVAASTSTASSFKLKMWRREPEITWTVVQDATTMTDSDDFEELEILQMTVASTSAASHLLHKEIQDAVQEDEMIKPNGHDDSRADRRQSIVEPATPSELAVPSTSTSTSTASHSTSYQSLLLQKKSLKFEIDNIGKVMSCCATAVKRWLSVIDDKPFPEKEYLQEYMEGTDKLHELQCKEMELEDKQEKILEMEKLKKLKRTGKETKKSSTILLVHLPNNQHTTVKITKGLTLRQAVAKPMQRRQLILEDCAAYIRHRITYFISWDTDISTLQCNEVFVETLEQIPVPVFLSHHFVVGNKNIELRCNERNCTYTKLFPLPSLDLFNDMVSWSTARGKREVLITSAI